MEKMFLKTKKYYWFNLSYLIGICLFLCASVYAQGDGIFRSYGDVLNAPRSDFFTAEVADMVSSENCINNHPWLSEELLFVQSNTRILVCQNPKGELRYSALPTQVYPVPTNHGIPNGPGYGPGMYYHFDAVNKLK